MAAFDLGQPPRKSGILKRIVFILVVAAVVIGGYFALPRFEWKAPQITLTPDTDILALKPIEIEVTEQGTGLESLKVVLFTGGTEHVMVDETYDQPVMQKKVTVAVTAKLTGIKEGPAVLRE